MERVEWVTDAAGMAELAPRWDALAAGDATPFASHAWFSSWWEAFGGDRQLRIATLERDGALAAVLPMLARGPRRGLAAMSNWHTPAFRLASADEHAARDLVSGLLRRGRVTLELRGLRDDDPVLAAVMSGSDRLVHLESGHVSPALEIAGSYEAWLADRPKTRARDLRRRRRRLEEEHQTQVFALRPPDDLESELAEGLRVEAAGWKARAGTAIVSRPETRAFYTNLARRLHAVGQLRFSRLEVDGRAIAFEYMVVHQERVFSLKGGYDEQFRAFAPGLQVQVAAIARAFEEGLRSYEFLGADEPWKRSLANAERRHVHARAYPTSPAGRLSYATRRHVVPRARDLRGLLRRTGSIIPV